MSSSRQARQELPSTAAGPNPEEQDSNDEYKVGTKSTAEKSRKKPRTSKQDGEQKRVKGVRGKLKMLTEMPLDVLFEIFGHLHPWDVLRLARTTKSFRDILMRRSSISIWKSALSNTPGMPECPKDMTEPEFVNLAYDKHCHFCSASVQDAFWALRLRCCRKCIDSRFQARNVLYRNYPVDINSPFSSLQCSIRDKRKRHHIDLWLVEEVERMGRRLNELKNDEEALKLFVDAQRKDVEEKQEHAIRCTKFFATLSLDRSRDLDDARDRRKVAIIEKLEGLGWGDEIEELNEYNPIIFSRHPIVNQPKDLTDRIWANNRSKLIEFMETCKADRLTRQRRALLRGRVEMASILIGKYTIENPTQIIPGVADICLMSKELRDVILESDPVVTVDESSFDNWLTSLPDICQAWRRSKDAFLANLLPSPASSIDDSDIHRFQLATTYFTCNECLGLILYPRILAHTCMTSDTKRSASQVDLNVDELWNVVRSSPWNHIGDKVRLHEDAFNAARLVVLACGKDPAVTTAAQMDQLDARVECRSCSAGRIAMTWRAAVSHSIGSRHVNTSVSWQLVDEVTTLKIKATEESQPPLLEGKHYRCVRCGANESEFWRKPHLSLAHNINREVGEHDFYLSLDEPLSMPYPVNVDTV